MKHILESLKYTKKAVKKEKLTALQYRTGTEDGWNVILFSLTSIIIVFVKTCEIKIFTRVLPSRIFSRWFYVRLNRVKNNRVETE